MTTPGINRAGRMSLFPKDTVTETRVAYGICCMACKEDSSKWTSSIYLKGNGWSWCCCRLHICICSTHLLGCRTLIHACTCEHTHTKLAYNLWLKNIYVLQWLHKLSSFPGRQNVQALPPVATCFVTPAHFVISDEWKKNGDKSCSHCTTDVSSVVLSANMSQSALCFYHMQWEIINKKWNTETRLSSLRVVQIKLHKGHLHTHSITTQQQTWVCLLERNGVWRQLKINSSDWHQSQTQSGGDKILVT